MTMTGTVTSSNPSRRFPFGCDVNVPDHNSHAPIQGAYPMILTAADRLAADSPIPTAIMLTHSKHMGRLMRFNEFLGKGSIQVFTRFLVTLFFHGTLQCRTAGDFTGKEKQHAITLIACRPMS